LQIAALTRDYQLDSLIFFYRAFMEEQ